MPSEVYCNFPAELPWPEYGNEIGDTLHWLQKYAWKGKVVGGFGGSVARRIWSDRNSHVHGESRRRPLPGKAPLTITLYDPDHSWEPVDQVRVPQAIGMATRSADSPAHPQNAFTERD
jgi:hypothetical protein